MMVQIKCIEIEGREGVAHKRNSTFSVLRQLRKNEYLYDGEALESTRTQVRCQEVMQGGQWVLERTPESGY